MQIITNVLSHSSDCFFGRNFWCDKNSSNVRQVCMTWGGGNISRTHDLPQKNEKCLDIWFYPLGFRKFGHVQAMSGTCSGHFQLRSLMRKREWDLILDSFILFSKRIQGKEATVLFQMSDKIMFNLRMQ